MDTTEQMPLAMAELVQMRLGGLWGTLTAVGDWLQRAEAWTAVWGQEPPTSLLEMLHPDDRICWPTAVVSATSDQPYTFDARLHLPDKQQYCWYQWRVVSLDSPEPTDPPQFALQAWDIHRYKKAESIAQNEHDLLLAIVQTAIAAIVLLNKDGQIIFASEQAEEILGLAHSELTERTYDDPAWQTTDLDGSPWPDEKQPFRIVMETGQPVFNIRHAIVWPDGQRKALSINGAPLHDERGLLTGVVFLIHNITKQLETERTLRQNEDLFRGIVESQVDIVSRYKPDSTLLYVNEAYCRYFGYAREELIGRSFLFLVATDEQAKVKKRLDELHRNPSPGVLITQDTDMDGHSRWVQWADYGLLNEKGELYMVQAVGRDITDLKLLEIALRDSRHHLETLISNLPGFVYRCQANFDWHAQYISEQVEAVTGYKPEDFRTGRIYFSTIILPEWREIVFDEVQKAIAENQSFELVYQIRHRAGDLRWVWERGRAVAPYMDEPEGVYLEGFITDITEQKRAEEVLLQSQKAESLGVLAGGIAHDFNNLLVAILGQSSLALRRLPDDDPVRKPINKVVQAAKRAANLTRQLLAYSGQKQLQTQALDINALIQENVDLLQVAMAHRVELVLDLATELPPILADAGQVQQIVMNLVLNAVEAIGDKVGTVWIHTAVVNIPPYEAIQSYWMDHPLKPGRFVQFQVRDNGSGMSNETLERIFDPFFTTKFTGRGLGLSAVVGIMNSHRGSLDVSSTLGDGTTFTLLFPVHVYYDEVSSSALDEGKGDNNNRHTAVSSPPATDLSQFTGTILVIDDEPLVREAVRDMLADTPLQILEAASGFSGLDLFITHRDTIRLILLDVSMPQLSGYDTLLRLREIDAHVPIVLSSGYQNVQPDISPEALDMLINDFIHKPYQPQKLYRILANILSSNHN